MRRVNFQESWVNLLLLLLVLLQDSFFLVEDPVCNVVESVISCCCYCKDHQLLQSVHSGSHFLNRSLYQKLMNSHNICTWIFFFFPNFFDSKFIMSRAGARSWGFLKSVEHSDEHQSPKSSYKLLILDSTFNEPGNSSSSSSSYFFLLNNSLTFFKSIFKSFLFNFALNNSFFFFFNFFFFLFSKFSKTSPCIPQIFSLSKCLQILDSS